MHLIVGFVLTALLRKKNSLNTALPSIHGKLEVVHTMPGRMRLCAPLPEDVQNDALQEIKTTMGKIDGIEQVKITPRIGSLLIHYDKTRVHHFVVHGIVVKLLGLEKEFEKVPDGWVSREVKRIDRALSQQIYQSSGGLLDLRSSIMIVVFSLALYWLLIQGDRSLPGGLNLLWWTTILAQRGAKS